MKRCKSGYFALCALLTWGTACPSDDEQADDDDNGSPDDDDDGDDDVADDDDDGPEDLDGDGVPRPEDCDDLDPDVHPGADDDQCDEVDQDCDGQPDQNVELPTSPSNLGDLTDEYETFVSAYLFPDVDEDSYRFYLEDTALGYFDLEVWLYGVPEDADYMLELHLIEADDPADEGLIDTADLHGRGGEETINFDGTGVHDDSGTYEVIVRSVDGSSCRAPYLLQLISRSL